MTTTLAKWGNSIEDRPEKIDARHHDRLAVVYIRQSSMTQVHRNQESTKIQYGLTGMAEQLGWARERILTIAVLIVAMVQIVISRPRLAPRLAEGALSADA